MWPSQQAKPQVIPSSTIVLKCMSQLRVVMVCLHVLPLRTEYYDAVKSVLLLVCDIFIPQTKEQFY